MAIRAQERAGLDVITDGEIRRESYSNHFATALEGVDIDNPGEALDRSGHPNPVPRVVGPIGRPAPVQVRDVEFLRAATDRTIKVTVPGPFTMAQQAQNDYYPDTESLAMAYAEVCNAEARDLFAAGADIVQFDEPYLQARPEPAREFGVAALNRALDGGLDGTTAVHLCFGYAAIIHERPSGYSFLSELADCTCDQVSIETAQSGLDPEVLTTLKGKRVILGVLDLSDHEVESPEVVAAASPSGAGRTSTPQDIVLGPDCGMKYLPRASAEGKLRSMTAAAEHAARRGSAADGAAPWRHHSRAAHAAAGARSGRDLAAHGRRHLDLLRGRGAGRLRLAEALTAQGIRRGDLVVLTARTTPPYLLCWLALATLGAISVPTDPAGTVEEMAGLLGQVEPPFVVTDAELAPQGRAGERCRRPSRPDPAEHRRPGRRLASGAHWLSARCRSTSARTTWPC